MRKSSPNNLFTRTLNITNPLLAKSLASAGALSLTHQYGSGPVQKSIRSCFSPSCVDAGTESAKAPEEKYDCQRETSAARRSVGLSASTAGAGKKLVEERELRRAAKSGGVTSETNQGMDFGLKENGEINTYDKYYGNSLEDDFRYIGGVCDEEIGENKVRKELQFGE